MIEVEARAEVACDLEPLVAVLEWGCPRLGVRRASVGLMVVGEPEMATINGRHRDRDTPTDVLAFPLDGPEAREWATEGPAPELGDIVICPPRAQEPLTTLVLHGLLHLLGYDHEVDDGEMLALQDELVEEAPA